MKWKEGAPVEYLIRTSARAKNLRLQLSPRDGLMVVVPLGYDLGKIPAMVEKKRGWIEAHLIRFAGMAAAAISAPVVALPETIVLPALGESWQVTYRPTRTRHIGVTTDGPGRLTLYGAVGDEASCREVLRRWLYHRTREELVPWLGRLAQDGGFSFREAVIRGPKTRWASCSSKGRISLSFKLLFLERDWVRCVLLHELCHRQVMNHSPRFWALLSRFEPDCRTIRKKMRDAWRRVPPWAEERPGNRQGRGKGEGTQLAASARRSPPGVRQIYR